MDAGKQPREVFSRSRRAAM